MRYILLIVLSILASAQLGRSQCAPNNPTGSFGFFPSTELLACVDRGQYYDETFHLENVDRFVVGGFGIDMEYLRIDSIKNVPCNLNWITNKGNNTFGPGETGCIRVFGLSNDSVGQYKLQIYVSLKLSILGELDGEIDKIISDMERLIGTSLGVDFRYFIRVREPLTACPAIDYDTLSPLLRTATINCPNTGSLAAQIVGDTVFCNGNNAQLNLALSNVTNPSVEWIPDTVVGGPYTNTTNVLLTESGYVTVVVTDTANTGGVYIDRLWVQVDSTSPIAGVLAPVINGRNIKLEASATNSTSFSWTLGDQTVKTGQSVLHTYAADGIYPISLTVNNSCGSDVYYDTLYIGNVGINNLQASALQCNVFPNPASGNSVMISLAGLQLMEEVTVQVVDVAGKSVMLPITFEYHPGKPFELPVKDLASGVYVFQVKTLHSSISNKLIIY